MVQNPLGDIVYAMMENIIDYGNVSSILVNYHLYLFETLFEINMQMVIYS